MERCEICETPNIAGRCAGLDVPELAFCAVHLREHKEACPDVKDERSTIWWIKRTPEGGR